MALSAETTTWMRPKATKSAMKGMNQSGFAPVRRRSRKILDMKGETSWSAAAMALVRTTKASAALAPRRRSAAKSRMLAGEPSATKPSPGVICRTMPVNSRSK